MEDKDLKELTEQLRLLNGTLASAMSSIHDTIPYAAKKDQPLLRRIFGRTEKQVFDTDFSLNKLARTVENGKRLLAQQLEELLKSGIRSETDADMSVVVQSAGSVCEQNLDATAKSLEQLRLTLQRAAQTTAKEVTQEPKDSRFSKFFQEKMRELESTAKGISVDAYDLVADASRKASCVTAQAYKGLMSFGSAMHEATRRLSNVRHALRGETFETGKFQPQGFLKKITDFLATKSNELNKEAREAQAKSESLSREVFGFPANDFEDRDSDPLDDYLSEKAVDNFMDTVLGAHLTEKEFCEFLSGKDLSPSKNLLAIQLEYKMKKLGISKEDVVNGVGQKQSVDANNPTIDLSFVTEEDKAIAEIIEVLGQVNLSFDDYTTYLDKGPLYLTLNNFHSVGYKEVAKYEAAFSEIDDLQTKYRVSTLDVRRSYDENKKNYYRDIAIALAAAKVINRVIF